MNTYYIRTDITSNINDILNGIENTCTCEFTGAYFNWYIVTIQTPEAYMLFQLKYGDKQDGYMGSNSYKVYVL
jgi:hypothetical protein